MRFWGVILALEYLFLHEKLPCVGKELLNTNLELISENFLLIEVQIIRAWNSHDSLNSIYPEVLWSQCTHHWTPSSQPWLMGVGSPVCFIICNLGFKYCFQSRTEGWDPSQRRNRFLDCLCHMLLDGWSLSDQNWNLGIITCLFCNIEEYLCLLKFSVFTLKNWDSQFLPCLITED